jgi:hypothetical protein
MNVRFYINPETDEPHIYCHRVTEEEGIEVLQNPGEDRVGQEEAWVAIGQTAGGRHLRVIYVPEGRGAFGRTAYELTGKPLMHIDGAAIGRKKMRQKKFPPG